MNGHFKTILRTSAAMAAFGLAAAAFAQEAAPAQTAAATADEPSEIVVTAQKRTERLQDVPIAVSVISGDAIANQGGVNIENVQYLVPSLNFRKSGTTLNQFLYLRGIGTANFSIAAEPSVSTVLDGVVLANAGEAFGDLVDVERIEVLRGPQGTLFGKNASAGVINIVSKRPSDVLGGYGEGGYFFDNGNEYRVRGVVNLPLSPSIRSRLTGFYGKYDGNIRNIAPNVNDRVNGYEHYGARAVVEADASDKLTFKFIADYRHSDDECCAEVLGTLPTNLAAQALPASSFARQRSRTIAQNLVTATKEESWGVSMEANYDVGAAGTVTSITSYRNWDNTEIRDGDFLPAAYIGITQLHDVGPQTSKTYTQELRLTSPSGQFFEYVLGAYYSHADNERTFTRNDIVCAALGAAPATLTPCTSPLAAPSTFPSGTATFGSTFKNSALFGQATVNISDALRLIGGLRYTHDELDVFHKRVTTLAGPGINGNFDAGVFNNGAINPATGAFIPGVSNGIPFAASNSKDNVSGRVGVQYDMTPSSTLYGTYARGYKGPAYNIFFNMTATSTNLIAAETADSFELGLKNTLAGGKVVLNIAAYYAKYDNFQANNPDLVAGVVTTRLTNAGTVSTRGIEVDVIARPSPTMTISGGLAYTVARIDNFRVAPGAAATTLIPSGTPLTSAPKLKVSVNGDKRFVTGRSFDFGLGGSFSYTGEQLSQLSADPVVRLAATIPNYSLTDVQASIIDKDDRWKLTAIVRNLFDRPVAAAIQNGGPGGSYRYQIPREADRYYGITLRVNFGG